MYVAERAFDQCAHHQPNHLVEEAVAVELDREARAFLANAHGIDCADCAWFGFATGRIRPTGGLPTIGGEAREVMSADEMFCC